MDHTCSGLPAMRISIFGIESRRRGMGRSVPDRGARKIRNKIVLKLIFGGCNPNRLSAWPQTTMYQTDPSSA